MGYRSKIGQPFPKEAEFQNKQREVKRLKAELTDTTSGGAQGAEIRAVSLEDLGMLAEDAGLTTREDYGRRRVGDVTVPQFARARQNPQTQTAEFKRWFGDWEAVALKRFFAWLSRGNHGW